MQFSFHYYYLLANHYAACFVGQVLGLFIHDTTGGSEGEECVFT
jgi:hypothetical protein